MNISYNSAHLRKSSSVALQPEAIYAAIRRAFPGEEPMLARRSISGSQYQWTVPTAPGEIWRKFGEASPAESPAVRKAIADYKNRLKSHMGLGDDDLNALFTTPDDNSCVFFNISGDKVKVSIVAWDFVSAGDASGASVVLKDNMKFKQDVKIGFSDHDNLVGGLSFNLRLDSGFTKTHVIPATGLIDLGKILVGLHIMLEVPDKNKSFDMTVTKGQEKYIFDITEPEPEPEPIPEPAPEPEPEPAPEPEPEPEPVPEPEPEPEPAPEPEPVPEPEPEPEPEPIIPPVPDPVSVDPVLIVIDKEGKPVPSFPIDIMMPGGDGIHTLTGPAGEFHLPTMKEGDVFSVSDGFSNHTESFIIEPDKDKYYFRLDYVPTMQNWDITIKVVDEKGKPVYPGKLSLTQNGDTLLSDLPQDATIGLSFGTFKNDIPITVKLVDGGKKEYKSTDFKLVEGETEYLIQLDSAPCPAWKKILEVLAVVGMLAGAAWCYPMLWDIMKDLVLKTY